MYRGHFDKELIENIDTSSGVYKSRTKMHDSNISSTRFSFMLLISLSVNCG